MKISRDIADKDININIEEIVCLERQAFSVAWTKKDIQEMYQVEHIQIWTAKEEEIVVGYCILSVIADECEILRLATDLQKRKLGIATKILQAAEKDMYSEIKNIFLEVREHNTPARNFYTKHGFTATGIRKQYYSEPKEDAVLMMKIVETGERKC